MTLPLSIGRFPILLHSRPSECQPRSMIIRLHHFRMIPTGFFFFLILALLKVPLFSAVPPSGGIEMKKNQLCQCRRLFFSNSVLPRGRAPSCVSRLGRLLDPRSPNEEARSTRSRRGRVEKSGRGRRRKYPRAAKVAPTRVEKGFFSVFLPWSSHFVIFDSSFLG